MNTVVGIDLGSQALKVIFYDFERRRTAAMATAPLAMDQAANGKAEQQTNDWLVALRQALAQVDANIRQSARAIAVAGQQHGLVALDAAGQPLLPVKLWCDTSTTAECAEITQAMGGNEACLNAVGNLILPGYTASKVLWLKKLHPQLYERLHTILLPHDYLNFYLTGELCMEAGDASGTGFFDVRKRDWSQTMLRAIDADRDLRDCLPAVRFSNEPIGTVGPEVAEELGIPPGIPVAIGGGDNMMGAIGTGNVRPGKLSMSLGTSGTVYGCSDQPVVDPEGTIAGFCSSTGDWLPLFCTMNCTVATELMRALLGADLEGFEHSLATAPAGSDGVLTLPFFNGERTPNLPMSRGAVMGLSTHNSKPANLLRSAVEGATYGLRFGIDRLTNLGMNASEIVLTGGGARSASWRQVVADICDLPIVVLDQDEGAAMGAALQALQLLQPGAAMEELAEAHLTRDESRSCAPSDAAVRHYRDGYREYRSAVSAMAGLYQ